MAAYAWTDCGYSERRAYEIRANALFERHTGMKSALTVRLVRHRHEPYWERVE